MFAFGSETAWQWGIQMSRFRIVLAALVVFAIHSAPAWAEKRAALVIGNAAYVNSGALTNPVNDANDVAAA